jgi:hypothetical protein
VARFATRAAREGRAAPSLRERLERLDWPALERAILERGFAATPRVLTPAECADLVALYPRAGLFRKRVEMERHRFGVGDYQYFAEPLPGLVLELRSHAYRRLAPVAQRMAERLREARRFPPTLEAYHRWCRSRGQRQPTPLLLHYRAGGYNCLHRDLYGDEVFPLQLAVFLSRPGRDYEGGAFLLVQQRPRSQSVGEALVPGQGEMVIFAVADHPVPGRRGFQRAVMRHGVATVTRGERYTLGVIFHDARS